MNRHVSHSLGSMNRHVSHSIGGLIGTFFVFFLLSFGAYAACPATPIDCASPSLNNLTILGNMSIGTTQQNFPSSGNLVGTTDNQTLLNKNINASEINSGVLSPSLLPNPTPSSYGGVYNFNFLPHQFLTYLDISGSFHAAQPQFSDIGGQIIISQLPIGTSGATIPLNNGNNNFSGNLTLPDSSTWIPSGLTLSTALSATHGGTLGGTFAGSPTYSGAPVFSGTLKSQSLITMTSGSTISAQVGNNTTGNTLQLNGATSSESVLEFATAGTKNAHIQLDSTGDLQGYIYTTSGTNALKFLQVTSATGATEIFPPLTLNSSLLLTPTPITVSGSDAGTPGSTQVFYQNETIGGATSSSTFAFNRMAVFDNLNVTGSPSASQAPGMKFDFALGGAAFQGGRSGVQINMTTPNDMPNDFAGSSFVAFQPKVTVSNNTVGGTAVEVMNPVCGVNSTSTGYTANLTCAEIDSSLNAGASPMGRQWQFLISTTSGDGQQGYSTDAMIALQGGPSNGTPIAGFRNALLIGGQAAPVNYFNGAILTTSFQAQPNPDAAALAKIGGVFGFNLSNFAASDSVIRWPGGRIENGEADLGYLRTYQGASGPVLDATRKCVSSLTWNAGGGYVAGEQIGDRFGGNLVIDTVNGSGIPQTWHWANSQPPCLRSGEVAVVSRGMTHSTSASGAVLLNSGVIDVAVGDTVIAPSASGVPAVTTVSAISNGTMLNTSGTSTGSTLPFSVVSGVTNGEGVEGYCIPGGDTVLSQTGTTITLSVAPNCQVVSGAPITFLPFVTLSASLTQAIPANTPVVFELTGIPSNPVTLFGGSGGSGTANYTWGAATTLTLGGTAAVVIAKVPTSCSGLTTGTLYNNSGTAAFCP